MPTLDITTWPSIFLEQRQRYTDLKRECIDEPAEKMNQKGEEDLSDNNPLALSEAVCKLYLCIKTIYLFVHRIHGNNILLILKLER